MRLSQRLLRALEVTQPQPDLAERVEPVGEGWGRVVRRELLRRLLELLFGDDLRTVDATDPGEPVDRLSLAPAVRGLGPFARTSVVGRVPAGRDHGAVRDACDERGELPVDGCDRGLLHRGEPLVGPARLDQNPAALHERPRLEIRVVEARADLDRPARELDGALDVSAHLGRRRPGEREVPVREGLRLTLEEPLAARDPGAGDRLLALERVLVAEVERGRRRENAITPVEIGLERAFLQVDGEIGACGEPCRLRERPEVVRTQAGLAVGGGQELEGIAPPVLCERHVGCREVRGLRPLPCLHLVDCPIRPQDRSTFASKERRRTARSERCASMTLQMFLELAVGFEPTT